MYLVTGGSGFIGSNLVKFLNENLMLDVCVVDWINESNKRNIEKRTNITIVSPENIKKFLGYNKKKIELIIHLGAITSTTETNAKLILKNNIDLSLSLWDWCTKYKKRFIYASSAATYGDGNRGFDDTNSIKSLSQLQPLNLYGWSKHIVDKFFLNESKKKCPPQWVGLKFFNVYGPNEYHKGEMKSIVYKIYENLCKNKIVNLFKSHNKNFLDGEQLRDFIYVKDVISIIHWFIQKEKLSGIFNVGSGKARTFNDLAENVFKFMNENKKITYIDTPHKIRSKYQYFTEAKIKNLRKIGYKKKIFSLEEGIEDYVKNYLLKKDKFN